MIHILVALVLGAITTIVVAGAGFRTIGSPGVGEPAFGEFGPWFVTVWRAPAAEMYSARIEASEAAAADPVTPAEILPWWAGSLPRPNLSAEHIDYNRSGLAVGWPFLAAQAGHELYGHADGSVDAVHWPMQLLWTGLLADLSIFAFLWLTLIRTPRSIRDARRRQRGLCPACAYDQRGAPSSICSECGRNQNDLRAQANRSRLVYAGLAALTAAIAAIPIAQTLVR